MENAVDPVANPEVVLKRLKVDVAGPSFDGPGDDQVHETNDRTFRSQVFQMPDILSRVSRVIEFIAVDIFDELVDILRFLAVIAGDVIFDHLPIPAVDLYIDRQGDPQASMTSLLPGSAMRTLSCLLVISRGMILFSRMNLEDTPSGKMGTLGRSSILKSCTA